MLVVVFLKEFERLCIVFLTLGPSFGFVVAEVFDGGEPFICEVSTQKEIFSKVLALTGSGRGDHQQCNGYVRGLIPILAASTQTQQSLSNGLETEVGILCWWWYFTRSLNASRLVFLTLGASH